MLEKRKYKQLSNNLQFFKSLSSIIIMDISHWNSIDTTTVIWHSYFPAEWKFF